MTGRQGRRRMKLLDDLKERRGYSHLKEEALDRTMWRARFGRGFGPVVRHTTKSMNIHSMNQYGSKFHTRQTDGSSSALVITIKCRTKENVRMEAMLLCYKVR